MAIRKKQETENFSSSGGRTAAAGVWRLAAEQRRLAAEQRRLAADSGGGQRGVRQIESLKL
jgi:hypothetical protein